MDIIIQIILQLFATDPIQRLFLGFVTRDSWSVGLYLVLFGYYSLVFGADWLGHHQNGASAYVLHLSGSSSHLHVSSLIAVFLQIAPYVCSSPLCNNQISLHRTKQAGSLCDPRPWHHVCAHYSSPLCNNQTNTTQSTDCTMCMCVLIYKSIDDVRGEACVPIDMNHVLKGKMYPGKCPVKGLWRDFILIRLF